MPILDAYKNFFSSRVIRQQIFKEGISTEALFYASLITGTEAPSRPEPPVGMPNVLPNRQSEIAIGYVSHAEGIEATAINYPLSSGNIISMSGTIFTTTEQLSSNQNSTNLIEVGQKWKSKNSENVLVIKEDMSIYGKRQYIIQYSEDKSQILLEESAILLNFKLITEPENNSSRFDMIDGDFYGI